jgi:V/A-type H+-transporting ATPase subunit B
VDQRYLQFGRAFEEEFIGQGPTENRTIEQTLNIGWRLLSIMPTEELTRVSDEELETYYQRS